MLLYCWNRREFRMTTTTLTVFNSVGLRCILYYRTDAMWNAEKLEGKYTLWRCKSAPSYITSSTWINIGNGHRCRRVFEVEGHKFFRVPQILCYAMFEMSSVCSNASSKTWTPLPDRFTDEHLVENVPTLSVKRDFQYRPLGEASKASALQGPRACGASRWCR